MNPFMAVVSVILHLKRTCPVCRRDQVVPASKRSQTVPCKFCGADVPPRKGLWCLTSTRVLAKWFISSVKMHLTSRSTRPAISSLTPAGRCLLSHCSRSKARLSFDIYIALTSMEKSERKDFICASRLDKQIWESLMSVIHLYSRLQSSDCHFLQ